MKFVESRINPKGQVSIPAAVRRRLGLLPGTRIEWLEKDGKLVVRRASRFSSRDIHDAVFGKTPEKVPVADMDAGNRAHLANRHAAQRDPRAGSPSANK